MEDRRGMGFKSSGEHCLLIAEPGLGPAHPTNRGCPVARKSGKGAGMRNSTRPGGAAKLFLWLDISPGKHGGIEVQVQFKSTDRNADTHCCVCGQGFEL